MILRIKKRKLKEIYIVLFIFVLVFAPPILPQINLILAIYSIGMLLVKHQKEWSNVFIKSGQLQWCFTILCLLIYACCIIFINAALFNEQVQMSHYSALFNRFIILTLTVVPSSLYIISYLNKNNFTQDDFVKCIVKAGLLQVICVFASFFSSEIKSFFIYFMKMFNGSSLYDNTWYITVRSYGFARTLVDIFGFGMGIIAGISYLYGLFKEKKYVVYSLFIAVAGTLNARTTIVIYIVAIVFSFFYMISKMKLKMMIKSLVYIVLAIICIINLLPLIEVINKSTYDWIVQAFDTLSSFLFNEETTGTFSALFSKEFWQLPELFQIIFGTGHSLYNADGYSHSDVGYINDLWFVGIVGMSLVYGSIALLLIRAVKTIRNNMYKICMLFMGVSALVFNIKASVIGYNPGVTTMLSMIFVMLYFNSANKEMVEKKVHSFKEYHLKKNNYRR